ncbi:DUF6542 domain-containing protein [Mycobacterium colombiense]|uniref:DUF6542 domain-containing protein n=1 Tax=Mycobacterium colombiense CECT 3035 TaxID=1041522 RepID=J4JTU3_9MYCO|nr:hypothetical protein MCOL_V224377 [Mycobacterium colombiense CECT 3035]
MEGAHRSIHPNIPGVPWYAALLIAVTATAIGYGIDAGHKELTHVFAGFYIAGCVAAVLAVRQDGIFTTIIQPPLILFGAVPGAYWLFHDAKVGRLKDLLINCGYPLIERFPLMLGTAGGVLAIGLARWYFGNAYFGNADKDSATANASEEVAGGAGVDVKSFFNSIVAKAQAVLQSDTDADDDEATDSRRERRSGSSSRARRTTRSTRSSTRSARARSRHSREPLGDGSDPVERPERPRRSSTRRSAASARDYDAAEPARRPRRRPRPDADADPRGQSSREARREPRSRRNPYERPTPRSSRFDGFESYGDRYDPPSGPTSGGRYGSRYDAREPYEPSSEPRRRRPPSNGSTGTHHPISQVRYRGAGSQDPPREPHTERRSRSRTPGRTHGRSPAESWEYDV